MTGHEVVETSGKAPGILLGDKVRRVIQHDGFG
jgi:hypothetical protein